LCMQLPVLGMAVPPNCWAPCTCLLFLLYASFVCLPILSLLSILLLRWCSANMRVHYVLSSAIMVVSARFPFFHPVRKNLCFVAPFFWSGDLQCSGRQGNGCHLFFVVALNTTSHLDCILYVVSCWDCAGLTGSASTSVSRGAGFSSTLLPSLPAKLGCPFSCWGLLHRWLCQSQFFLVSVLASALGIVLVL
jgi:hypothetical protein